MSTIGPRWDDIIKLAEQLLTLVRQSSPKRPLEIPPPHVHILGIFWRALRLYDGVLTLLRAELPEESAFLARSLFEESLRLRELAEDSTRREALILGWASRSIQEKRGLMQVAKQVGLDSEIDGVLASLERDEIALQGRVRRGVIGKLPSFRSVRDASVRFDRRKEYWIYQWSHESVHGTDAAWLFARKKTAENAAGLYAKTADVGLRSAFSGFASRSFVDATDATSRIFGWTVSQELARNQEELEALIHVLANTPLQPTSGGQAEVE